jgi:hypothetical protein
MIIQSGMAFKKVARWKKVSREKEIHMTALSISRIELHGLQAGDDSDN